MNKISHLYLELTAGELEAITARHFAPATLKAAKLLPGGLFNTTYLLELSDGQRLVLRMGPVNRHLLMDYERNMMRAEAHVYDLCHAQGVPVSHMRVLSTEHDLVDRDYMIVDYIHATAMSELELTPDDRARLYGELGAVMRRMHAIRGPRFGRVAHVVDGRGYATWREAVLGEISDWKLLVKQQDIYTANELEAIDRLFARLAPVLDAVKEPGLAHGDLWAGNVLVSGAGADSRVAAVIDTDRAMFGDPEFDFVYSLATNEDFMRGYGSSLDVSRDVKVRRSMYAMICALQNSYVWLVQYDNLENSNADRALALGKLEELSAY